MSAINDISGMRFGRCNVIRQFGTTKDRRVTWSCVCDCGVLFVARGSDLRNGHTTSCGCFRKERTVEANTRHGMSDKRLCHIWYGMKDRCFKTWANDYHDYGGRGIIVCDEWLDFQCFAEWALKNGYADDLTIERVDNNGNYEPTNCTFVSLAQQHRNTRKVLRIDDGRGGYFTAREASKMTGASRKSISALYHSGTIKTIDDIRRITFLKAAKLDGQTLHEAAKEAK